MIDDSEQLRILDSSLKQIKTLSTHMKTAIDHYDIRLCLKASSNMISELKISTLTAKNYYKLFTAIYDEMHILQTYFKDEINRGRRIKELYEAVQQSINIVPRIFLMIVVAGIFIESNTIDSEELIYDLLQMMKGVQNPIRGLFTRYFFLKMIDSFYPKQEDPENNVDRLNKSIEFLIENLAEMNRLWIKVNTNLKTKISMSNNTFSEPDKEKNIIMKERNELKVLVGENITRLSSLENLSIEIYKKSILPKILNIVLESKDPISQQYILECVIHGFPDEYNIKCINEIISVINQADNEVDSKAIYASIIDKIISYNNTSYLSFTIEDKENLISIFKESIEKFNEKINNELEQIKKYSIEDKNVIIKIGIDVMKLTELEIKFLELIIKCSKKENKLENINQIMSQCYLLLSKTKGEKKMSQNGIKLIMKLLSVSLDSPVSIFEIKNFPDLMNFLDETNKLFLSLKIINNLVNDYNLGSIDNKDKMMAVLELVKPLIIESQANNNEAGTSSDVNSPNFLYQLNDYDISTLIKIIFVPCSKDPFEQLDILVLLKDSFLQSKNGKKILNSLISIINALILLGYHVSQNYDYQIINNNGSSDKYSKVTNIKKKFSTYFDLQKFKVQNDDSDLTKYKDFYKNLYDIISESIEQLSSLDMQTSFKLRLNTIMQINNISLKKENDFFSEQCELFTNKAISIFKEGKIPQDQRLSLLTLLIGNISNIKIINNEKMNNIKENITNLAQNLFKRNEQCIAMLNCIQMYNKNEIEKIIECLQKAKKYADYAMTSPENAILFVYIINNYIRLDLNISEFGDKINGDSINDLIDYLKNFLQTLKNENRSIELLNKIEKYFNCTLEMIKRKKNAKEGKLIEKIKLDE